MITSKPCRSVPFRAISMTDPSHQVGHSVGFSMKHWTPHRDLETRSPDTHPSPTDSGLVSSNSTPIHTTSEAVSIVTLVCVTSAMAHGAKGILSPRPFPTGVLNRPSSQDGARAIPISQGRLNPTASTKQSPAPRATATKDRRLLLETPLMARAAHTRSSPRTDTQNAHLR
jgi:hypothetical protein